MRFTAKNPKEESLIRWQNKSWRTRPMTKISSAVDDTFLIKNYIDVEMFDETP